MSQELFPPAAVTGDSPRLKWMSHHAVRTTPPDAEDHRHEARLWWAWTGAEQLRNARTYFKASGESEDAALIALALKRKIPDWKQPI